MWKKILVLLGMSLPVAACQADTPAEPASTETDQEEDLAESPSAMMTGNQNIYKLIPRHSKLCIGMPNAAGSAVAQLTCNQHNNDSGNYYYQTQDWWLKPAGAGSNLYEIRSRALSMCLGVQNASTSSGAAVVREACTGGAHQIFKLEQGGEGRYKIIAQHSKMCLDISGGPSATGSGAGLVQKPCTTDPSQNTSQRFYLAARLYQYKWAWGPKIYPKLTQGTTVFRGTANGWAGDIVHASTGGSDWWYSAQEADGTIRFTSWAGYKYMSVKGGSTDDGAVYEINYGNGAAYQQFYLNASLSDSSYQLVAKHSDKCAYATPAPESKVRQGPCNRDAVDQQFYIPVPTVAIANQCSRSKLVTEPGNAAPVQLGMNYWPAGTDAKILQDYHPTNTIPAVGTTPEKAPFNDAWVPVISRDANELASLNVKAVRLMLNAHVAGWNLAGTNYDPLTDTWSDTWSDTRVPVAAPRWDLGGQYKEPFERLKTNLNTVINIFASRGIKVVVAFGNNYLADGRTTKVATNAQGQVILTGNNQPARNIDWDRYCWSRDENGDGIVNGNDHCKPWWEHMRPYQGGSAGLAPFLADSRKWVGQTIQAIKDGNNLGNVLYFDLQNEVGFLPFYELPLTPSDGPTPISTMSRYVQAVWDEAISRGVPATQLGFSVLKLSQGDHMTLQSALGANRNPGHIEVHTYLHETDPAKQYNTDVAASYDMVKAAFPGANIVLGEIGYSRDSNENGHPEEDYAAHRLCAKIRDANKKPYSHLFHWAYYEGFGGLGFGAVLAKDSPTDVRGMYADLFASQQTDITETVTWPWACRVGQTCPGSCSDCGASPQNVGEFVSAVDSRFVRFNPSYQVDTLIPGPGLPGKPNVFPLDPDDQHIYVSGYVRPSNNAVVTGAIRQFNAAGTLLQESTMTLPLVNELRWQNLLASGDQRVPRAPGAAYFEVKVGRPSGTATGAGWFDLDGIAVNAQ